MRRRRVLLAVGHRSLVPVVPVGDQERRVDLDLAVVEGPGPGPHTSFLDVDRRLACRPLEHRLGVVQQENRLELGLRRTQ